MSLERVLKLSLRILDIVPDEALSDEDVEARNIAIDDLTTLLENVTFE